MAIAIKTATPVAIGEPTTVAIRALTTVGTISIETISIGTISIGTISIGVMVPITMVPMVFTATVAMATPVSWPLTRVTRTVSIPARAMHNDGRTTIRKDRTSTGMGTAITGITVGINTSRPPATVSYVATKQVTGAMAVATAATDADFRGNRASMTSRA